MDASAVAVFLFFGLVVATFTAIHYSDIYRRKVIEAEGLRTALDYRQAEENEDLLVDRTERFHREYERAHERLEERFRWDPFRNTLLNRRVFEYEIAKSRFLAADANGPLHISTDPTRPDFVTSSGSTL